MGAIAAVLVLLISSSVAVTLNARATNHPTKGPAEDVEFGLDPSIGERLSTSSPDTRLHDDLSQFIVNAEEGELIPILLRYAFYPPLPEEIEVDHAYNHWPFLAMEVTSDQAKALARLPGVTGLYLDRQAEVAVSRPPEALALPAPQLVPTPGETFPFMGEYPALLSDTAGIVGADTLHGAGNTGEGVIIAVLDTGIDKFHPNLDDLDDDPFTFDPKVILEVDFTGEGPADFNGHGTHVAGIAAGTGEAASDGFVDGFFGGIQSFPIAAGTQKGIAPGAFLYNVKVCSFFGFCLFSDMIAGVEFAIDHGADVISMSIGGFPVPAEDDPLLDVVTTAVEAGLTFVVSAGNAGPSGYSITTPATAPDVIAVGATYETDFPVYFSSRGPSIFDDPKPDLVAPGFQVVSALSSTSFFFFGGPGIRYLAIAGTSMSAPHVSGAAALLISAFPGASPHAVKAALMEGADDLGLDYAIQGTGRLNVAAALAAMEAAPTGFFEVPIPERVSPPFGLGELDIQSRAVLFESPHPYPNNFFDELVITEPGATQIRAHFPIIAVEFFFDFVIILDGDGNFVASFTGFQVDVTTPFVQGETMRVLLVSDFSITDFGYVIDRIDFKKPPVVLSLRSPSYAYDRTGTDVTVFLDIENTGSTTVSLDVVFTAFDGFGFPVGTATEAVEEIEPGEFRTVSFTFFATSTLAAEFFRVTAEASLRTAAPAPGGPFLFGTDARNARLILVDIATGEGSFIGNTGIGRLPALAFDPNSGVLYGGRGGGLPFIYTIDPATGSSTFFGDTGLGFAAVGALDITLEGTIYASVNIVGDGGTGSDHLATIGAGGLATVVGPYGPCVDVTIPSFGGGFCEIEGVEGLAVAPDGTLYASSGGRGAAFPALYTVDPTTGAATLVAPILDDFGIPPPGGVVSLQFTPDGTLFGGTGGGIGDFVSIDPATGIFTPIGSAVPTGGSLGGLALCPEGVISCPTPTGGASVTGSTTVLLLDKVTRAGDNPLISTLSPDRVDSLSSPHIVLFPGDFNLFQATAITSDSLTGAELRIVGDVAEVASFSSASPLAGRLDDLGGGIFLTDPIPLFYNVGPQFDAGDILFVGDLSGQVSAPIQILIPDALDDLDDNGESALGGSIQLIAGGEVLASTPISIEVDEPKARVLFDDVFQDFFDAERLWGGGFLGLGVSEWWRIVAQAGFDVDSLRQIMANRGLPDPWTVLLGREFNTLYFHDTELHDFRRAHFAQVVEDGDSVVTLYDFGFDEQVLFDDLQLDCTVRFLFGFVSRDCNFIADFGLIDAFDPEHPIARGLTTLPLQSAPFTLSTAGPAQAVAAASAIGSPESSGVVLGALESEEQGKYIAMGDSNIFDAQLSAPDLNWLLFFFFFDVDIAPFQNEGDLAVNILAFAANDPPEFETVGLDRTAAFPGETITVTFDVADAARVEVSLIDPEGKLVTRLVVDPAVVNSVTLTVPVDAVAGIYEVRVTAVDGMDDYAWALELFRVQGPLEGLMMPLALFVVFGAAGTLGFVLIWGRKNGWWPWRVRPTPAAREPTEGEDRDRD